MPRASRRRGGGWIAQHGRGRLFRGGFATARSAADWLAQQLGCTRASLKRDVKVLVAAGAKRPSHFRGVVYHQGRWHARTTAGKVRTLGTFTEEIAAARCCAAHHGLSLGDLRRPTLSAGSMARRFRILMPLFDKYTPADIASNAGQGVKDFLQQHPATRWPEIEGTVPACCGSAGVSGGVTTLGFMDFRDLNFTVCHEFLH